MEIEGAPEKDVIKFDRHEISCYPWHITTKYYEADVHFVQLMERDLVSQEFSGAIEAVVIYFDNHDVSCDSCFVNYRFLLIFSLTVSKKLTLGCRSSMSLNQRYDINLKLMLFNAFLSSDKNVGMQNCTRRFT